MSYLRASGLAVALSALLLMSGVSSTAVAATSGDPCVTTVPPGFVANQVWTLAGSPYCVSGNIDVAQLTIQPGVEVRVAPGARISVLLGLQAVGTAAAPILFTAAGPTPWQGILFQGTAPGSNLKRCVIEGSSLGGLRIFDSSPTIEDCLIQNNTTTVTGGGIDINNATLGLTLTRCRILNNSSTGNGGGVHAVMGTGSVIIDRCTISGNTANQANVSGTFSGGGVAISGNSTITGSLISENTVKGGGIGSNLHGGGIVSSLGTLDIHGSIVRQNTCANASPCDFGGGPSLGAGLSLSSGVLIANNSVFVLNVATNNCLGNPVGGAVNIDSGVATLTNVTIADNSGTGLRRGGGTLTVKNSIIFGNNGGGGGAAQVSGTAMITYSDVQGGWPVGNPDPTNISFNPVFGLAAAYQVVPGSLCIDAGDPSAAENDTSMPPSLGGQRNDMGAHGGPGAGVWAPTISWTDVGLGLAGATTPHLEGSGHLIAGFPMYLNVTDGPTTSNAFLFVGITALMTPFKGGTFIPFPNFIFSGIPIVNGASQFSLDWPEGLPSGFTTYYQYWFPDATGPSGFTASNGVFAQVP